MPQSFADLDKHCTSTTLEDVRAHLEKDGIVEDKRITVEQRGKALLKGVGKVGTESSGAESSWRSFLTVLCLKS